MSIGLRDVLDVIGDYQRLVPGAEDLIAVDGHLDHVPDRLALQFHMDGRRQNFIVSVNIAQREFDPGEDVPRFPIGHLVGQFHKLSVLNGFTHLISDELFRRSKRQKS